MRNINERVEECMQNKALAYFVKILRKEGNIPYQKVENREINENPFYMDYFEKNKRLVFGIVIFQEFLKEITASLFTKEMICEMLKSYEDAYLEDAKLECAFATFSEFQY